MMMLTNVAHVSFKGVRVCRLHVVLDRLGFCGCLTEMKTHLLHSRVDSALKNSRHFTYPNEGRDVGKKRLCERS